MGKKKNVQLLFLYLLRGAKNIILNAEKSSNDIRMWRYDDGRERTDDKARFSSRKLRNIFRASTQWENVPRATVRISKKSKGRQNY